MRSVLAWARVIGLAALLAGPIAIARAEDLTPANPVEPGPPPLSLRAERRWPADAVPRPIKDGPFAGLYRAGPPGDASALRVDFDAASGALIHLGVDTEGGGREKLNLLREPGSVSVGKPAEGKVASSAPGQVKVEFAGTSLEWKAGLPDGGLTLTVTAPAQSKDDVEVRLPLRPALSAVTVLGGRWEKDGTVRPPFLLNAPDLGLVLVKATPADAGIARIQGMRDGSHGSRNNKLDLSLITKAASGKPVAWSFEPVQLPPPEGLKDTALWPAVRRGWLNALQATAPWGDASSTVSAPSGLYANNVLSDLVSGLMHSWGDAVLLSPALPQGIELNEAMRRTVDFFLTRQFPLAATHPRMKLIRSEAEIAALGNSSVMVSAETDGVVPCYHDHIQMLDGNSGTLIGAWDVWKADGNDDWLATRWEVLEKLASFLERNDTDGDGLVESPNSGDEGTFAMEFGSGSSAYDTVNAGHKDASINIQVYRAWLGVAGMAEALGHPDRAAHWRERAARLRAAFRPCFSNPETGWLGWWRSRDGVLHDYASPWVTGAAVRNGLLSPEEGRPMLEKLWAKIDEVGFDRFDLGIPTTLLPIKPGDYHYGPGGDRSVAANPFKQYLNGGCCVSDTVHFLVASHMAGLGDRADRVLAAMLERQWAGAHDNGGGFQNGIGGGGEFYTWDGTPCGYEGHLTYSYTFLQTVLLREPAFRERLTGFTSLLAHASDPIDIGNRRELFVDRFLIDQLNGVRLQIHTPRDEGIAFAFDKPWEGPFSANVTMVRLPDGSLRAYYRGKPVASRDGSEDEVTCVAESKDGRNWTKPELDLYEANGTKANSIVLMNANQSCHNFSPFRDTRPGVPETERFKAFGGTVESGIAAWKSADGYRWERMAAAPVMSRETVPYTYIFDSQNVPFWSEAEGKYVAYYRVWDGDGIRRIARSESSDFLTWTPPILLGYRTPDGPAPVEHIYTNQTSPYFRAPHLYVAIAARFMPGRQVLTADQAKAIHVNPDYFKDISDAIFMTTRPAEGADHLAVYDRTFPEGFIRPGIGAKNWVSRSNYPALNVVPTGPAEVSVYVNQDYAQSTAHLRRYSLRVDGFASLHCGYGGGHAITKPLVFAGRELTLNFSTSAAGGVKVGIEEPDGKPIPGFTVEDCQMQIGNEIDRKVTWKSGTDVSALAGKPVRLRFVMKDADLYSIKFEGAE